MQKEDPNKIFTEILIYVKRIDSDYTKLYAGVTLDAETRQEKYKRATTAEYFKSWNIETKENALVLEKHLHKIGFKERNADKEPKTTPDGLKEDLNNVYVFKYEKSENY